MNSQTAPPIDHPLANLESGEQLICEIKRNILGIIGVYVGVGILTLILGIVIFAVAPHFLSNYDHGKVMLIGTLVFVVFAVIAAIFVFINHTVYWGNRWIVTSHNITQIRRTSLFDKETSQLSLANLEDISAAQDGVMAHIFNYGVISAETAAATDKFTFTYCSNPTHYTQQILAARERFEQNRRQVTIPENPPAQTAPPATENPTGSGPEEYIVP